MGLAEALPSPGPKVGSPGGGCRDLAGAQGRVWSLLRRGGRGRGRAGRNNRCPPPHSNQVSSDQRRTQPIQLFQKDWSSFKKKILYLMERLKTYTKEDRIKK